MSHLAPVIEPRPKHEAGREPLQLAQSLLANAHEAVLIYDARLVPVECRVVFVNAAFVKLTGAESIEHVGRTPFHLAGGDVTAHPEGAHTFSYERAAGSALTLEMVFVPLEDERGRATHIVAFCRDQLESGSTNALRKRIDSAEKRVTALRRELRTHKRSENRLLHATCRDTLTGLPNRLLFLELVKEALVESKRSAKSIAVLFLDCDRFKLINDTFGHLVGDLLLVEVARRMKESLRSNDVLARIGSDEFAIIIGDGYETAIATNVAQRISKSFSAPFNLNGEALYLTVSIGIALSGTDGETPEELLRDADIAMYHAKQLGKQRCEVFSVELRDRLLRRRLLDTELRRALERSELSIAYQPIVRLADGRLEGFEALIRWQHSELGAISPQELITVAEESSLIVDIGDWMLRESCAQMSRWQRQIAGSEALSISVNVSVKQLLDERFTRRVSNALMQSGLRAERLHLEITESTLMLDSELATALLTELAEIGVRSHVDDFGTGYSSLTYLQRFPVAALKIDRSFVSGAGEGIANPAIVRTIASLAQHLGLPVVAEGVETSPQERELRALGCTYGQGYYYAKPLAADAIVEYLTNEPRATTLRAS